MFGSFDLLRIILIMFRFLDGGSNSDVLCLEPSSTATPLLKTLAKPPVAKPEVVKKPVVSRAKPVVKSEVKKVDNVSKAKPVVKSAVIVSKAKPMAKSSKSVDHVSKAKPLVKKAVMKAAAGSRSSKSILPADKLKNLIEVLKTGELAATATKSPGFH